MVEGSGDSTSELSAVGDGIERSGDAIGHRGSTSMSDRNSKDEVRPASAGQAGDVRHRKGRGVDSAAENIDYLEVRWAPRLHLRRSLNVEQVVRAVLSGLASGPIRAVAIVCAMRQHAVEENVELARIAGRFAGRGVVGFDLAG